MKLVLTSPSPPPCSVCRRSENAIHAEQIRELLEVKGVGANNANDRGVRPMHIACQSGNSHLVQRLLELGESRSRSAVLKQKQQQRR